MGDSKEHDPRDVDRNSAGINVGEGKDGVGDVDNDDSASGDKISSIIFTEDSDMLQGLPSRIGRAIRAQDNAMAEYLLMSAGRDTGIEILKRPYDSQWTNEEPELESGTTAILHAAKAGDSAMVEAIFSIVKLERQMHSVLTVKDDAGTGILLKAVKNERPGVFKLVLNLAERELEPKELRSLIEGKDKDGETLLSAAVRHNTVEMFGAALDCVWKFLTHHQRCSLVESENKGGDRMLSSATDEAFSRALWSKTLESGHLGLFESMIAVVPEKHRETLEAEENTPSEKKDENLLWWALAYKQRTLWGQVVKCSENCIKVAENHSLDDVLAACIAKHLDREGRPATELDTIFSLMSSYALPSAKDLKRLFEAHSSNKRLPQRCLSAVTSATNPLITGINLSVILTKAAKTAIEAERRKLLKKKKKKKKKKKIFF